MALSLGIEYSVQQQKTCVMEGQRIVETMLFTTTPALLSYIEDTCARYPEPIVALSMSPALLADRSLAMASEEVLYQEITAYMRQSQRETEAIDAKLEALNLTSYRVPTIQQLTSIPRYRKLNRDKMGSSSVLGSVATLLYRMRRQDAAWSEMHFLYLDIKKAARSIVVVQNGTIVDGITRPMYEALYNDDGDREVRQLVEAAFWEGLTQDMAALMALHHCEDVVLLVQRQPEELYRLREIVIERLGDIYPCYLYPSRDTEPEGFEAAIGTCVIAEGLYGAEEAAEVVTRLQLGPLPRL
jgi:hypothetical protein